MSKWVVVVVGAVLLGGLALGVILAADQGGPPRTEPRDAAERPVGRAELNKPYFFQVGHCGLGHVVEFDGSYWDLDRSTMNEAEEMRFGINADTGAMTLVAADTALYESLRGGEATLRRHVGAKRFEMCS